MIFHFRSSYSLDLHAFVPITLVFMSMSYSRPFEYHFQKFLGLLSHKNESLVTLIHPWKNYGAIGDFMDLGYDFVPFSMRADV